MTITGILTVPEIAKLLRVSDWKVYQLLETKKIKGFKIGRQWRVPAREVDEYVSTGIEARVTSDIDSY